jgi:hypothetical protein
MSLGTMPSGAYSKTFYEYIKIKEKVNGYGKKLSEKLLNPLLIRQSRPITSGLTFCKTGGTITWWIRKSL